ncbi:hypothetical protein V2J09_022871 [Rumex salicifolius]
MAASMCIPVTFLLLVASCLSLLPASQGQLPTSEYRHRPLLMYLIYWVRDDPYHIHAGHLQIKGGYIIDLKSDIDWDNFATFIV